MNLFLLAADIWDVVIIIAYILIPVSIIAIFGIVFLCVKRHKDFIYKAESIKQGMTVDEVLEIMGCSATTAEEEGRRLTAIWEKNQWVGIFRGGTLTRSVKVVFINGRVTSVTTKNFDKSTL